MWLIQDDATGSTCGVVPSDMSLNDAVKLLMENEKYYNDSCTLFSSELGLSVKVRRVDCYR